MSVSLAPKRRLRLPTIVGLTVALLLTVVGAAGLVQATEVFLDWFESGRLAHAEALIRSAEINESSTEIGVLYEVVATYDVSWNGTLTRANRVAKFKSLTFDQSAAAARLKVLQDAKDGNVPLVCYLAPATPELAVLFLDFPYLAIGVSLLLGAGLTPAGVWLGLRVWGTQKRQWQIAALQYRLPKQPWVWEPNRFEGRCPVQRRWPIVIAACLVWNIPACGLSLLVQAGNGTQNPLLLALAPPVVIVGLVIFAITLCAFWILGKYGEPELVVRPWPLQLGDPLECKLRFQEKLSFKKPLTVQLEVSPDMAAAAGFQQEAIAPISVIVENEIARWSIPSPWRVEPHGNVFNPDDYHIANWQIRVSDGSRWLGFSQTYDVLVYHCPPSQSDLPGSDSASSSLIPSDSTAT